MDQVHAKKLEYFPLTLLKKYPDVFDDHSYELRNHVGKVEYKKVRKKDDLKLPEDSLLYSGHKTPPKVLFCITMFNESYFQLLQSFAGIFRAYYEL